MDDMFNTPQGDAPEQTPPTNTPPTSPQNTQPPQAPYSTPYNAGYGAPRQAPYGAPQYSAPYTPPYGSPTQSAPTHPQGVHYTHAQNKKKKMGAGKIFFIALICISIVLSSIAIFSSLGEKVITGDNSNTNSTVVDGEGAAPNKEDSPVSFKEYSGKGAMTPEQIYVAIKETNVGVLVYSQNQMVGEGSGIIVGEKDKYTYILTAAHVIADKNINVQIQFSDETEADAVIIGVDTKTDIGVVRVEKTGLKAATFGNSDKLNVGQKVYAIGNPGGTEFFGSFTSGMISAIDRPVPTSNSAYDLPCIQHNAAINPGNSGGALVNEYGQVIGLNSSKISSTEYEGMGFAVPSTTLLEVYDQIIKHGYVSNRPMLGINYTTVASDYNYANIAWKNNLPYGSIVIAYISPSSDLNNHGIQVGDIVTAVNGKKMDSTDVLLEEIENAKVGDQLTLTVCRLNRSGGISTTFDAKVKLVEDRGDNTMPQEEETEVIDPFSYFEDFGY